MTNWSIAAKTGTAEMAKTDGTVGYDPDRFLHTFFGYFPAYDPEFLVFLIAVQPETGFGDFAVRTLTDPFVNITKFLLSYYDVKPDR